MTFIHHYLDGFMIGAGLIIAIGAQNAFVLRQGIMRKHRLALAMFCSFSDALLITAGISGMGVIFTAHKNVTIAFSAAGAAYLLYFAFTSFRSAYRGNTLVADASAKSLPMKKVLITIAALTYLNPHVYLDTVVMLGSFGASRPAAWRPAFALGAISASFAWFFSLAYGAAFLAPVFRSKSAWRILDASIGVLMIYIAFRMAAFAFAV
jgi:L-lysine exporter family protein LysE/ArgO